MKTNCKHSDPTCAACEKRRAYFRAYLERNKTHLLALARKSYHKHKDAISVRRKRAPKKPRVRTEAARACTRAWVAKNKSRAKQLTRAWIKAHPERVRELSRKSYAKNREAILARRALKPKKRRLKEQTPELRAYMTAWKAAHKDELRLYTQRAFHRRRAKLAGLPSERIDMKRVAWEQGGLCYLCSTPMGSDVSIDHIVPIAHGGGHVDTNVAAAHRGCNSKKHARSLLVALLHM